MRLEEVTFDNIWYVVSEVQISEELYNEFKKGYVEDTKYALLLPVLGIEDGVKFLFEASNGLIFNIKVDGIRRLYILYNLVKRFLEEVYDNKYYFGRHKMLYELKLVIFLNKMY